MAATPSFARRTGATILGLLAYFAVIVVVTVCWGVFVAQTGLAKGQGMAGGAMLVFVPMMLLWLAVIWFVVRIGLIAWKGRPGLLKSALVAGLCAFAFTFVYCGPKNCFIPGRDGALSGWFLIAGTAIGAAAQSWAEAKIVPAVSTSTAD